MNSINNQASFKKQLSRKLSKLIFKKENSKMNTYAEDAENVENNKRFKNYKQDFFKIIELVLKSF